MAGTEHRRRHCQVVGDTSAGLLGSAFMERAAHRLGRGCEVLAGFLLLVAAVTLAIPDVIGMDRPPVLAIVCDLVLAGLCGFAAWLILSRRVCTRTAIRIGVALELVGALTFSAFVYLTPLAPGGDVSGVSGVSIWILIMPFLVPLALWRRCLVSALGASMPLLVVGVVAPSLGFGLPNLDQLVQVAVPNWLCGLLGILVAAQVTAWGAALTRAEREVEHLGSYHLLEKLGEGGMGEVWRAEHRFLARPAAVKFVRRSEAMDPTAVARFEREALATARLSSPYTVRIYDYGLDDDGRFFYVMELLDGLDLDTFLSRFGPMPPARVVHLAIQICKSLAEAHDQGLIHRDIKPANIYLCRLGGEHDAVKVLDFGLVIHSRERTRGDNRLTENGFITGTPGFVAPEAARGQEELDHRVDVYSLGCVLFLLLTGQTVVEERGKTPMDVLMSHIREERRRPSDLVTQPIPEALERLILDCVAVDAAARPADMRSLARRLAETGVPPWTEAEAEAWWLEFVPAPALMPTPAQARTETTVAVGR